MMPASRWERAKELLEQALALGAEGRDAFLAEACAGDLSLRREVESLVASSQEAGRFLAGPDTQVSRATEPSSDAEPLPGHRLGPYRVLGRIGRGGMGDVYCAVRDDDHFKKMVAIKLTRRGADGDETVRRFRAERQILAHLEHPGIARLLDGGATEDGRPFLVMEHVEGVRIDTYAGTHGLDTRARLKLFQAVCAAVHYAHQNLVVHRDLKPGNILVTGEGAPKLLDFGIAKLLDPDAAETAATVSGLMTLAYASPEQIRSEPITTASDVYSLGVVLYELLAGCRPYRLTTAGSVELQQAICEQDPPRPGSTVKLHADIDAIVLKALHKEPGARYHSAEQLSEDIERHLSGRPVRAREGDVAYRWGKFLSRHRVAAALSTLVALSLVGGLVGTAWQARVAGRERRKAESERARAERRFADVRTLANSLLFDLDDAIRELPGSTPARRLVVNNALQYLDSLSKEAGDDVTLQKELATAYDKVGAVQGYGSGANLGDTAGAYASLGKALAIRKRLAEARPDDVPLLLDLAATHRRMANLQAKKGDVAAAAASYREAVALADLIARRQPQNAQHRSLAARSEVGLGRELAAGGDLAAALQAYQRGLKAAHEHFARNPPDARQVLALAHQGMGDGLQTSGQPAGALEHAEAALALFREAAQDAPEGASARREEALARLNVADALRRLGRESEALDHVRTAQRTFERLAAADPSNALAQRDVWAVLYRIGTAPAPAVAPAAAVEASRRAAAIAAVLQERDPSSHWALRDLAWSHRALGDALARDGRHAEALRSHRDAVAFTRRMAGGGASIRDRIEVARAIVALGRAELLAGEAARARSSLEEATEGLAPLAAADPSNADLRLELAQALGWLAEARMALSRGSAEQARAACTAAERARGLLAQLPEGSGLESRVRPESARLLRTLSLCGRQSPPS